jgi:hypothetical protein
MLPYKMKRAALALIYCILDISHDETRLEKVPTVTINKGCISLRQLRLCTIFLLLDNAEMVRRVLELSLLDWILAGRYSKEFS